jgi:mRNA interferase RelE/StbE
MPSWHVVRANPRRIWLKRWVAPEDGVTDRRYELFISPTARRALTDRPLESVAFAAYEFIVGPLLDNPERVGKRLRPPLDDRHSARRGTYRVVYRINAARHRVTVVAVVDRSEA